MGEALLCCQIEDCYYYFLMFVLFCVDLDYLQGKIKQMLQNDYWWNISGVKEGVLLIHAMNSEFN